MWSSDMCVCVRLALFVRHDYFRLQEAALHAQQIQHSEADTKLTGQLQSAQGHIARLESQLATASEAASTSQLTQSLQLKELSEQHSSMLSQLRLDHEMQLKAATEHHEVPAILYQPHVLQKIVYCWSAYAILTSC